MLSTSSTAAALLLTTVASSAPVSSQSKPAHVIVALAALAAAEIELERDGVAHGGDRGLDRRLGEQRAAEIGVQHRAGEIEHGTQARLAPRLRACAQRAAGDDRRLARSSRAACARQRSARANSVDDGGAAEALDCRARRACRMPQHLVDRRQPAQRRSAAAVLPCRFNNRAGTD